MAKVAIIADTHYGIRNDNQLLYDYFEKFNRNVLFPCIDKLGIDTVIHLGDVVDRRKYINYITARRLHEDLMLPMFERGLDVHVIIGNHDVAYKTTNEVNSMRELYGASKWPLKIYDRPAEVEIHGTKIAMMPWICQDTYDDSIELLATSQARVLMGHLDLTGFEEYKGHISENRMDSSLFARFDTVMSGHFHHRSSHGGIHYIGAAAQHSWSDYNDPRGFTIFDTETFEMEFVENPFELFHKFVYDDQGKSADEVLGFDEVPYSGSYTKVIVRNKTDPYLFDLVISKLEKGGVHDLQIVEDHMNLDSISDEDLVDEAQDTMTILKKYIASIETSVPRKKIENFIQELYTEALNVE